MAIHCSDPEGGGEQEARIPLKSHKNIGFLSNIGPHPLKNHIATKTTFNVGPSSVRQRNAISSGIQVLGSSLPPQLQTRGLKAFI